MTEVGVRERKKKTNTSIWKRHIMSMCLSIYLGLLWLPLGGAPIQTRDGTLNPSTYPWLGIKPITLWCVSWHSNHWATGWAIISISLLGLQLLKTKCKSNFYDQRGSWFEEAIYDFCPLEDVVLSFGSYHPIAICDNTSIVCVVSKCGEASVLVMYSLTMWHES